MDVAEPRGQQKPPLTDVKTLREAARRTLLVDIAYRDDVLSGRRADQNRRAARSHSDRANV